MNLSIETGLQEYTLNECCTIKFNPTDVCFIQKIYEAFEDMDKRQEVYKAELDAIPNTDAHAIFELMHNKDQEMREVIDTVLNAPVSNALFKDMNVFAQTSDGLPVWANLFLAIIAQCDNEASEIRAKAPTRLNKYLKKYHK